MTTVNDNTVTLAKIETLKAEVNALENNQLKDRTLSKEDWISASRRRDALNKEIEALKHMLCPAVNDGVTLCGWSDSHAYTVVSVAKNGKSFEMTQDTATLKDGWKPEFVPGGFAGHCTNQNSQEYDYKSNPEGSRIKVTLRKDNTWRVQGESKNGRRVLIGIRSKFHDYNF